MHFGKDSTDIGEQPEVIDIHRPVDQIGFPDNILARNEAPLPRIRAIAPVISHHKVLVCSYMPYLKRWISNRKIILVNVWFLYRYAIDHNGFVNNSDSVAGDGDNALDKILLGVYRVTEDDHISPFRRVQKIRRLIHNNIFLVVQCWLHALAFNVKVL